MERISSNSKDTHRIYNQSFCRVFHRWIRETKRQQLHPCGCLRSIRSLSQAYGRADWRIGQRNQIEREDRVGECRTECFPRHCDTGECRSMAKKTARDSNGDHWQLWHHGAACSSKFDWLVSEHNIYPSWRLKKGWLSGLAVCPAQTVSCFD